MPDQPNDSSESLERVTGNRGLSRRSPVLARHLRALRPRVDALRESDDTEVVFPDENLEWAIRWEIKKPRGVLNRGDMKRLNKLWLQNYSEEEEYEDITGLEHAVNLDSLGIWSTGIIDISPIQELINLTSLEISYNMISNFTPLAGLTGLETLCLEGYAITDLTVLQELTRLAELKIKENEISDISPLEKLTNLTSLELDLSLGFDISPIQELTGLSKLNITYIRLSDISPLESLTDLTELTLQHGRRIKTRGVSLPMSLDRIAPVPRDRFTRRPERNTTDEQIIDISPLRRLPNLRRLNITNNQISDISPLEELTNLRELWLFGNPLSRESIDVHIPELQARGVKVTF
jgi:internalin A